MLQLTVTVLLAPALVGAATLAGRRWGVRVGGVVSAFPAIVGPVLLIDLLAHGAAFAARAAAGTLLGLVALSAFVAAYGRLAPARAWPVAVLGAWTAAAVSGAVLAEREARPLPAAAAATASLVLAALVLRGATASARASGRLDHPPGSTAGRRGDLPARMVASAVLVVVLAAAAGALGPFAGGLLAALPVLASVLAVCTHRREGPAATVGLLGGMVGGMAGFVVFCLAIALLVERGPAAAFAVATVAAVAAQLVAATSSAVPLHRSFRRAPYPRGAWRA